MHHLRFGPRNLAVSHHADVMPRCFAGGADGKRILEKGIVGRGIDDSHVVVDAAVVVGDSCNGRDATVTRGAQSNLRKRLRNRKCTST